VQPLLSSIMAAFNGLVRYMDYFSRNQSDAGLPGSTQPIGRYRERSCVLFACHIPRSCAVWIGGASPKSRGKSVASVEPAEPSCRRDQTARHQVSNSIPDNRDIIDSSDLQALIKELRNIQNDFKKDCPTKAESLDMRRRYFAKRPILPKSCCRIDSSLPAVGVSRVTGSTIRPSSMV